MKFRIQFILALLFLVAVLASCKKAPEQYAIQGNVRVFMTEQSDEFTIHSSTEQILSCVNYPIIFEFDIDEDEIFINLKYLEEPELCYTSTGPAKATIELGELNLALYEITFSLNDSLTSGILSTTTEELTLEEGNVYVPD